MLIVNADDYGRTPVETDVTLDCYQNGRITSATAMVFMADSHRAADLSRGSTIDLGLHLNLSQPFTGDVTSARLQEYHGRVVRFITASRYTRCLYHPALRQEFRYVYQAQVDEFVRLYGRPPSHIDGHHHTHLCTNMLLDGIIPAEQRVRRSFYLLQGQKGIVNRLYRNIVDRTLARKHRVTDFFFSLQQCLNEDRLATVFELAKQANVEMMTHPANPHEYAYVMSDTYSAALSGIEMGTYASV